MQQHALHLVELDFPRSLFDRELCILAAPAEADQAYAVSVVCRGADEAHVRALLLQGLATGDMHLVELESTNIEGSDRVSVAAALRADKRNDAVLERVVGRLSLEPAVTSARWRVNGGAPS